MLYSSYPLTKIKQSLFAGKKKRIEGEENERRDSPDQLARHKTSPYPWFPSDLRNPRHRWRRFRYQGTLFFHLLIICSQSKFISILFDSLFSWFIFTWSSKFSLLKVFKLGCWGFSVIFHVFYCRDSSIEKHSFEGKKYFPFLFLSLFTDSCMILIFRVKPLRKMELFLTKISNFLGKFLVICAG